MAHSGKTITFATDLLPNEDLVYNLGKKDDSNSANNRRWNIFGTLDGTATTATNLTSAPTLTATGTATINLLSDTAYTLTVGGKSVIFQTPIDNDTHRVVKVNGSQILASNTTALNLKAGDNITITATANNGDITISATDTDTHYTATLITTNSNTGTSQSTTTLANNNVYLNLVENNAVTSSHEISGSTGIEVTTDTLGNISIAHTHTDITAKTAAASSASTLTWGGTFNIYEEEYDAQGHITGVANYSMTMPNKPIKTSNFTISSTANSTDGTGYISDSTLTDNCSVIQIVVDESSLPDLQGPISWEKAEVEGDKRINLTAKVTSEQSISGYICYII